MNALFGMAGEHIQRTIFERAVFEHNRDSFDAGFGVSDFLVREEKVVEPFGFQEEFSEELELESIKVGLVNFESEDTTELGLAFGLGEFPLFKPHVHTK